MQSLAPLLLLACPIGMGAMMWFMMRGGKKEQSSVGGDSLPDLKAEQARLAEKIAALEQVRAGEAEPARLAATTDALDRDQTAEATTPAQTR